MVATLDGDRCGGRPACTGEQRWREWRMSHGLAVTHRFVDAPGESETVRWHFVEAGAGPDACCCCTVSRSPGAMWRPILPELAKHFHCVAIDLKGYGQSDKQRGDYRHEGVSRRRWSRYSTRLAMDRFPPLQSRPGHGAGRFHRGQPSWQTGDRRWVRGSQHLIHFHPDLAPQELTCSPIWKRGESFRTR